MQKIMFLLAFTAWATMTTAQGIEFETESFHAIHVHNNFVVYVQQADDHSVTAEAPAELMDLVQITVNKGVLNIGMKDGYNKSKGWNSGDGEGDIIVHITFPSIDELKVSGGVVLHGQNKLELENLDIDGSGAAVINLDVRCDNLDITLSGAIKMTLGAAADDINLNLSGASMIEMSGETDDFIISCSGASNINAESLSAEDVSIGCSGSSKVDVWAKGDIRVEASGASNVLYKCKDCREVKVDATGAASVKKY